MTDGSGAAWEACLRHFIHPLKVSIIEAFLWVELPIAPKFIDEMGDDEFGMSLVSYHMRTLANAGILEEDHQEPVRGALQMFYRLADLGD
jgi:DNA-binding transcriptional ArsR family regulator